MGVDSIPAPCVWLALFQRVHRCCIPLLQRVHVCCPCLGVSMRVVPLSAYACMFSLSQLVHVCYPHLKRVYVLYPCLSMSSTLPPPMPLLLILAQ